MGSGYRYKITDPCICSKERKYGSTDCGVRGINSFFAAHTCNIYCKPYWLKPKITKATKLLPKKKTSTYSWEVPQSAAINNKALRAQLPSTVMSAIHEGQ